MVSVSENTDLVGMKKIAAAAEMSAPIIRDLVAHEGFPASIGKGGWVSSLDLIRDWKRRRAVRLTGMKAICQYLNRSEATVQDWIRRADFPAQLMRGEWVSDRLSADAWKRERPDVYGGGEYTSSE